MKSRLFVAVNQHFSFAKNCLPLITGTLIDPRFKTEYLTESETNLAKLNSIETPNDNMQSKSLGMAVTSESSAYAFIS